MPLSFYVPSQRCHKLYIYPYSFVGDIVVWILFFVSIYTAVIHYVNWVDIIRQ